MDSQRLRACLDSDYRRLREVAGAADPTAPVPSTPGWTVDDLVHHVGAVYLHKVECIRQGHHPDPWPPAGMEQEAPLGLLDRAYAALAEQFAAHKPADPTFTWYAPDQTVGFWIRRMAQETVIHRVDAELGAGVALAPIPADLAVDGIDELLVAFVEYGTTAYADEFTEMLADTDGRPVLVSTDGAAWLVRISPGGVTVTPCAADTGEAAARISGDPTALLLWLWNRGGQERLTLSGDEELLSLLRDVLAASTQ